MAFALVLVYALGSAGRAGATPLRLTLAGVALGAVLDGVSSGIRLVRPRAFDYLRFWDVGTLAGRPMSVALTILPFVLVGAALALLVARDAERRRARRRPGPYARRQHHAAPAPWPWSR